MIIWTNNIWEAFPNEEENFKEFCEINNLNFTEEEKENELINFLYEEAEENYNILMAEVKCHEENNPKFYVIKANLGLWDGNHAGGAVIKSFEKAFKSCCEDYTSLKFDGKRLTVIASHHDGQNVYSFKELTKNGEKYYYRHKDDMGRRELVNKLYTDYHYSHSPRLFKELYDL